MMTEEAKSDVIFPLPWRLADADGDDCDFGPFILAANDKIILCLANYKGKEGRREAAALILRAVNGTIS